MTLRNLSINTLISSGDWTLFLDRDGVINRRLIDDYVKCVNEFEFLPDAIDAIRVFSKKFKYIFVVTNQQGIGKGLMTEADLEIIHTNMISAIEAHGGRIDKVYHCSDLAASESLNRKPEIGMALQAQKDFPEVDFSHSIMVGDSKSDMQFGKNAGMKTVFITTDLPESPINVDFTFGSLKDLGVVISVD